MARARSTRSKCILSLAGTEFHGVRAVVTDLPDGDSVLDGILRFSLFRKELLTLDYPRHRLVLEQDREQEGDSGGEEVWLARARDEHVVPMRMPNGIPLVEIDVAGVKMEAGIDSGGLGLSIPASMTKRLRFDSGIDTVAYGRTQVSGFALRGAVLDGVVEFAGFRFEQPWLELNPMFGIANIGSGALRDFAVTLDQRSKLVRFTAPGKPRRLAKPRDLSNTARRNELVGTVAVTQVY